MNAQSRVTALLWNKALWLDIESHVISFSQSDCVISECIIYPTLKFFYEIDCCGQSYKPPTIVVYISRVEYINNLLESTTLES